MADNGIMVSVIVLTYNHKKYIRQALESILMQKVDFRYEILVGDDASTDGTSRIVREYARAYPDRIRAFVREQNLGATKNAYELLKRSRGRYLATCEGDDYWTDCDKLQRQVDFLEKNKRFIGCSHDCLVVDEFGRPHKKQRLRWVSGKRIYTLKDFKGNLLPGQTTSIVRRNIYQNAKYDYTIFYKAHRQVGDRTMILTYAAQGDFYHFRRIMSNYRRGTGVDHLTKQTFSQELDSFRDDLTYTRTLERYAKEVLKVNANFQSHKRDLFVSALYHWFIKQNREWLAAAKEILEQDRGGIGFFLYIPFGILKKVYFRLFFLD